jgi:hypothetical protein
MTINNSDVTNHVRYTLTLTRVGLGGKRYVAMKTSIEADAATSEEKVRVSVTKAISREMASVENKEALVTAASRLVWRWLQSLHAGEPLVYGGLEKLVLVKDGYWNPNEQRDCLHISIFTKKDEEEVVRLLSKL